MTILEVLRDLILGGRHSRRTIMRHGVSGSTADRWLYELLEVIPGLRRAQEGKAVWFEWKAPASSPQVTLTARGTGHRARARAPRAAPRRRGRA